MLTLSFLGLIPFAALSFFVAIYFSRTRRAQVMEQQNVIALSDQQIRIKDDKREENLMENTQSIQKSVDRITAIGNVKECNIQAKTNAINENQNRIPENISKDLSPEAINTTLEKNERIADNSSVQLQNLYSSTYQNIPKISPTIVIQGERMGRDTNGNQSSHQITSTPFTKNLTSMPEMTLMDRENAQTILNNFSHELVSSHPIVKSCFSQSTRISTEENSEYTEFTIPEFQTNISKSLMTEGS